MHRNVKPKIKLVKLEKHPDKLEIPITYLTPEETKGQQQYIGI